MTAALSTAREAVLSRIRTGLTGTQAVPVIRSYRGDDGEQGSVALLTDRLRDYGADVHVVTEPLVAVTLGRLTAGQRVVVPQGFPRAWGVRLDAVPDDPALSASELDRLDAVVTTCALAIAETGTVVLDAGAGQGRRAVSLVPDHLLVVVRAGQVLASVPQAIARLDPRRCQTWISGPSATSDIELQRVAGVHGPRRLTVLVVAAPDH